QRLLLPADRRRRRDGRLRRVDRLSADGGIAASRDCRRTTPRAQLAAQSDRYAVRCGAARCDLRSGAGGEPAARRERTAALRALRPGVLDAHGGRREACRSAVASPGDRTLRRDRRRDLEGVRRDGLRVGWAVGPRDVIKPMNEIIGHVGAWAPRPEQVASAKLLDDHAAVDAY